MDYREILWYPPYENNSIAIEVSIKSINNDNELFVTYDNIPFKLKLSAVENKEEDVIEIRNYLDLYLKENINRIFLCGKDIFKLKTERLIDISNLIQKYFPKCNTIGCFTRISDIKSKTDEELIELKNRGYNDLIVQIQLNKDKVDKFIKNEFESDEIIEQCIRLDNAKISYNIFYMLGTNNVDVKETCKLGAHILSEINGKILIISLLEINIKQPLYKEIQKNNLKRKIIGKNKEETKLLIKNLDKNMDVYILGQFNEVYIKGELLNNKVKMINNL